MEEQTRWTTLLCLRCCTTTPTSTGFKGIVESRELWATHIQYLNDAQEFDYAADLAKQVVEERDRASAEPRRAHRSRRLSDLASVRMGVPQYVCVASFSEVGDALSQWRGYCPNGAGYSIGFVTQDLVGEAARQGFSLARCLYDEESQREAILQVTERGAALGPLDRGPQAGAPPSHI